ncbi:hypothetical protein [Hydrogenophaga sp.]|uniref:hypothetical protein n=1 Tax=Hydrogenophaga sp. TaxID=1904254 RepID=UPI002FC9E187
MRTANSMLASALLLAAVAAETHASLDGHPSVTQYLTNDAPFVVFGVTPTSLLTTSVSITLTFIATDPLDQVSVFPFVRNASGGPAHLRAHVSCGPRDAGSWNCLIPVTALLQDLHESDGELGLRIEAHGDLRQRGHHSTVIVTLPVRRVPVAARR